VEPPRTLLRSRRAVQRDIALYIDWIRGKSTNGLHLGCGSDLIDGLANCDAFHPAADKAIGATRLEGYEDGSVDYIETHHMIEHLSFSDAKIAMREWSRAMMPGGMLVITCPDFEALIARWRRSRRNENWSQTIKMVYGSQEHPGMFHQSAYDRRTLAELVATHGFEPLLTFTPYPRRPTPSICLIGRRLSD
jgi:predicted SAM-dependent methyltransferase